MTDTPAAADGTCPWCGTDPLYRAYHDTEWGVPVRDDRQMFEMLVLESFQSGLSWITILRRREGFRQAFLGFDAEAVARMGPDDVDRLVGDAAIIRHRGKIEATIGNARATLALRDAGRGLAETLWDVIDGRQITNHLASMSDAQARTDLSDRIAKLLKQKGFRHMGSTTTYALMQATGLVNDHLVSCPRHAEIARATGDAG
ncbi:DNA-3-methyladenine glycosylase I [Tistrella bauzanensis]|uniref:DNA-3-methyladenine glycosylase I n=1 Tax=Tistrella bauzanensis TaxID=657419 RepID=A0ABQ1J554_9PROT|nr:DNA-3-methyladenine glycosylase I [Tistrella bauzanensis]GGB60272.1 DNA-3-methyladenine glycosylase I [Tistrella bauzanensis]